MNWTDLWMTLFGTAQWLGLDIGFWVSMGVVTLLVVLMNIVFWSMKPKAAPAKNDKDADNRTAL